MRPLVISIEGVLAKEPLAPTFAASAPNQDGIWLLHALAVTPVFATGSADRVGVEHWMRNFGLSTSSIEFPVQRQTAGEEMWALRLGVLDRITRTYRGNLVVVESSRVIKDALVTRGVTVIQPWWGRNRAVLDEDDFVPLRNQSRFWDQ